MIISFSGLIGSGKDTAADYLVNNHGFRRDSFASTLKDAVSNIFGWDRTLLEGRTAESRAWREQVDTWWSARLNIPHLTPRWVLQHLGTDVLRDHFSNDIWIASLENKIRKTSDNVVITDARFPNELDAIKNSNGLAIRIKRGSDPVWFSCAEIFNTTTDEEYKKSSFSELVKWNVHASEYSWAGYQFDSVLDNSFTVDELFTKIEDIIKNQE